MRQTAVLRVLAALFVFGSAVLAADPQLMSMVMPDAKVLAGVNAGSTRMSPLGQFILAKVATLGVGPQKFIAATGFDPLQDASELLAATTGDPSRRGGLLLVRGNFNVAKIVAAVSANLTNVQVQSYNGATLLSATNPKTNVVQALALIGNSVAVAGDLATVEDALNRNGAPIAIDPALSAQVSQLSSNEDEWLVSSVSVASLFPYLGASSASALQALLILRNIQSFSGGMNFAANVQLTAQALTSDAQNATALAAVLKLGVTFASTLGGNNAQLEELTQFLQTLQVTASGSAVNLSLAIPENQVEALLNQVLKPPTPAARAQLRSHRLPNGN
jgi:hypothetical protein